MLMRYITWLIFIDINDMMLIARSRLLHVQLTVVVTYLKWAASASVNCTKTYSLIIATRFVFNL